MNVGNDANEYHSTGSSNARQDFELESVASPSGAADGNFGDAFGQGGFQSGSPFGASGSFPAPTGASGQGFGGQDFPSAQASGFGGSGPQP